MRKGTFLLLLAVTAVSVATAAYAVLSGDRAVSTPVREQRVFPELAAHLGDLAWMRLSRGSAKIDFNLVAGRWSVVEKGNYPAAPGKVRRALLGLADLTLIEPKTERPELFGRLDLDDARNGKATSIALQDRMGQTIAELLVGKTRRDRLGGGNDAVYVRRPREDRVWLARGSLDLPAATLDWLDRRLLDVPAGRITSATLTAASGAALRLRREEAGGKIAVMDRPDDAELKPEEALGKPLGALADLDFVDVKPAAELPPGLGEAATAVFTTFDGLVVTLRLLAQDTADWAAIKATGSGPTEQEAAAINAKTGRWVFAIPAERGALLRTRIDDLIAPAGGS